MPAAGTALRPGGDARWTRSARRSGHAARPQHHRSSLPGSGRRSSGSSLGSASLPVPTLRTSTSARCRPFRPIGSWRLGFQSPSRWVWRLLDQLLGERAERRGISLGLDNHPGSVVEDETPSRWRRARRWTNGRKPTLHGATDDDPLCASTSATEAVSPPASHISRELRMQGSGPSDQLRGGSWLSTDPNVGAEG